MKKYTFLSTLFLSAMPTLVLGHTGGHETSGFLQGMLHPMMGMDHLLAMIGVGLWAVQIGGKARFVVPAAFVSVMVVAGVLGFFDVALPFVEGGIALSVIVVGALLALQARVSTVMAVALAAVFALFHGYAHGAEMTSSSYAVYALGFVFSTTLLHATGIVAASVMMRLYRKNVFLRIAGAATTVVGFLLFV